MKTKSPSCHNFSYSSIHSSHTFEIGRNHPRQEENKQMKVKKVKEIKERQEIKGHEENK